MYGLGVMPAARWLALAVGIVFAVGCGQPTTQSAPATRSRTQALVTGPDLVVTNVETPPTADPSGFTVAVTTCNQGTDPAPAYVDVVLSNDSNIAEPADQPAYYGSFGLLGPGECVNPVIWVNAKAPTGPATGAYYVGGIADAQNQVPESNEANNARASNVIGLGWGPDFVITDITTPPGASGPFDATVTVCNQGSSGASTNVDVFLSSDPAITTGDIPVGGVYAGYLSPGQCSTNHVWVSPPGMTPGTYYLGGIADAFNGTQEILETNNARASAPLGYGSQPDLVVTDVSGPPSVGQGNFDTIVTVCNQGGGGSPSATVELRVSADATFDPGDAFAGSIPVQPLMQGQCAQATINAWASVPDGAYYLAAFVDPGNAIFELNETNNARAGARVGFGSRPDLVVTEVAGVTSGFGGSNTNVVTTVCNRGTTGTSGTSLDLYVSVDKNITVDDRYAGSASVPPLMAGQCAPVSFSAWLNAPDGVYYLGAMVDPGNWTQELDETNNTGLSAQFGLGWRPDLVVTEVRGPSSLWPGATGSVDVTVCNQGSSGGGADVNLVLSNDANITPLDTAVAWVPMPYLSPGQCTSQRTFVNFYQPNGTYYLGAIVDSQGVVPELLETNNALSGGPISIGALPDFVVSSVAAPPTAGSGPFDVSITVCNQGTTGGAPNVDVFLSGDSTITSADNWIGSTSLPFLDAGQCTTQAVHGVGSAPQGVYHVGAIVDRNNMISELVETNNARDGGLIGLSNQPDLIVTAVSGPPSISGSGNFSAQVTVCNQGQSSSPSTNVDLKLSGDNIITSSDYPAGNTFVNNLMPGQCATVNVNGWAGVPEGTWYLGAYVDPNNSVWEIFEANNGKAGDAIGVGYRPDLVVTDVSGPTAATPGGFLSATATVCNQGTTDAYGSYAELHLSSDTVITPGDFYVGNAYVPYLTAGQCTQVAISGSAYVSDGAYHLGVIVDANNNVWELNEGNNTRSGPLLGVGYRPDFAVTAVSAPPSATPWGPITVTVTLCNQGMQYGGTNVDLFLSSDTNFTMSDVLLGSLPMPYLAPGECATQSYNTTAQAQSGVWYLGAVADSVNGTQELIETNNSLVGGVLAIGNQPDFVVTSVVGPPSAGSAQFNVAVTVCNQGTSGGSPSLDVFLSGDTTITPADSWVGGTFLGWLEAGQCATRNVQGSAPVPWGLYYVGAVVDGPNSYTELLENNNAGVGNAIGVGNQPDLIVSAVSGPPSVTGGNNLTAQVTICNQGQSSSNSTQLDLKLSGDPTITQTDFMAGSAPVNSLMPGECSTVTINGWAGVPDGAWYLGAYVDGFNSVPELFENNNGAAGGQLGVGFKPDLVVSDVTGPASVTNSGSFTATATVCNQGTTDSFGSSVELHLSSDATITSSDFLVGFAPLPTLAAGQCAPVSVNGPTSVPDGAYRLGAIVDPTNSVQELNESNNARAGALLGVGSKPDFIVTAVSAPPSAISGNWIPSISATVCNQGTQAAGTMVDLYLSSDETITRFDLITGGISTPLLNPGQCATVTTGLNVSVPDGIWYVGAFADSMNQQQELIETNNALASAPMAVGNGPDFVVRSVVGPPTASGPFNVAVTVCNQGTASGSTNVDIFQSSDATITQTDFIVGSTYVGWLTPGQCATRSVQAWAGPWGQFRLGAIADPQNSTFELIETNNSRAGDFIGIGSQPDLIVSSITAPPSVLNGGSFTAQVEVCNQGQSQSPSTQVDLRLSSDAVITSSDLGLGNAFVNGLSPGQCTTVSMNGWANVPDGPWSLGAIVDPNNSVSELLEGNNAKLGPALGVGAKPDFIISSVNGPPSIASGAAFNATVRVCNQGTVSGSTNVDVVFSPDAVISSGDPLIGGKPSGNLDPGQCNTLTIPVNAIGPDGAYYLGAVADTPNLVNELNEGNNASSGKRIGMGSYPDLVVTSVTAPAAVLNGSGFDVQVMVCNQGTTASNGTSVDVVLSTDAVLDSSDTFIGSGPVTPLAPGECYGSPVYANAFVSDGTYTIGAIADRMDSIFELIEDNNGFPGGQIGVGYGPDYYVASISAPAAVKPGSPFTAQVTYCNQGTASGPSVTLDLYQSAGPTLTQAATPLGGQLAAGLGANQCATVAINAAPLPGPDGQVFLGVIADQTNQVFELIESNDTSATVAIAVDSVPPPAPLLASTTPGSPSSSATPVVQGTAEANATVQLFASSTCGGTPLGSGIANAGGSFGVAVPVPLNAATPLSATSTDVAGNVSPCSAVLTYVHDSIPPASPVLSGFSPASPSNSSTSPSLLGSAEPGAVIKVFKGAGCTGTLVTTVTATVPAGSFSAGVTAVANSASVFSATATDAAGNVSACSASATFVHDNVAPATPAFTSTSPASPSRTSTTPSFLGTAEASATVRLFTTSNCTGTPKATGTATSSGTFSIPVTVTANSTTTLFASATDAAGNVSGCSAGRVYVHDSTPPAAPVLTGTSPTSPSSSTSTNVLGTAEANATVQLFANGTCTTPVRITGAANGSGSFSLPVTVTANSTTTFSAKAIDAAGNTSACSATRTYVHDSTAPAVPVLTGSTPASPSNASTTPTLRGTAEVGTTVRLFTSAACNTTPSATGATDASGNFSLAVTVASNSSTTFFATATDGAGNKSACSAGFTYVHDVSPPAAPVVSSAQVNGTGQLVQGTAEAGATVKLFTASTCSGTSVGSGTASGSNAFSISANATGTAVPGGSLVTFFANAKDAATNVSACSAGLSFLSCDAGQASCDGSTSNGCEVTLASDPNHCGTCSTVCAGGANAVAACNAGTCGLTCNAGFSDCDNNPANGCETAGSCTPVCTPVDASRELMITDTRVVEDPVRTQGLGAWTFGKLMTSMAGGQNASAFVRSWLETWKTNQVVNGFSVTARPNIQSMVITPWETASNVGPGGALDLSKAPFRLLAIVNRVDLRNLPNNAGEGRFVFGVLDGSGFPLQFTVILEYKLPGTTAADVTRWAQDWHALGQTPISDPTFNSKLQALTDRFAGPNLAPGAPNGSSIGQVRTNEIALAPMWQLREFTLNAAGALVPATVKQTPDLSLNNSTALANFINQNQTTILAGTFNVPNTFNSQSFLGGASDVPSTSTFWQAPGVTDNNARQQFSLNTCSGCHAGETGTAFLQISPRFPGQPAQLSDFLTGNNMPKSDPVSGVPRTFNDLARRATDLQGLACGTSSPLTGDSGSASLSSLSSSASDGLPPSNLPPARVH